MNQPNEFLQFKSIDDDKVKIIIGDRRRNKSVFVVVYRKELIRALSVIDIGGEK